MSPTETILGFPGATLAGLVVALEQLNIKAVRRSRAKTTLNSLRKKQDTL